MAEIIKRVTLVIDVPIYGVKVLFCTGHNLTQLCETVKKYGGSETFLKELEKEGNCGGFAAYDDEQPGRLLIWIPEVIRSAIHYNSLQHEIFHIAEYIFNRVGIPHNPEYTSEAWAYLIGFLTEQIYRGYWNIVRILEDK